MVRSLVISIVLIVILKDPTEAVDNGLSDLIKAIWNKMSITPKEADTFLFDSIQTFLDEESTVPGRANDYLYDSVTKMWDQVSATPEGAKFFNDSIKLVAEQIKDATPSNDEEYDFIVVGAGSAGSAIAARLSEISEAKVLIIEAGGRENMVMNIPALCIFLLFDRNMQWNHKNPVRNYCLGYKDNQCGIKTGKSLGGTGAMNFMVATRGNKKDYDQWAKITDDESWSYDEMLKYFKKLETIDVQSAKIDPDYRNFNGPVRISESVYRTPLVDAFIEAGREMGFSSPNDYNGQKQTGFSYLQTTQTNGERLTTNRAYLNPIKKRKNLSITMNSQATKVLINPKTKTAYGMEFIKNDKIIKVKARKEVILSAGALGSPKLLMLSGIGPAKELQSLNISVLQDAPVGENLMDHITYPTLTFFVNQSIGFNILDLFEPTNPTILEYVTERKGPLTTPIYVEGLAFVNIDDPSPNNEESNIELLFTTSHLGSTIAAYKAFNIDDKYYEKTLSDSLYRYAYNIWPILMQPKSRGKVSLVSADPLVDTIVDLNFFSHPDDIRVVVKAIRFAMEIAKTKAMQKYDSQRFNYTIPGCEKHKEDSDDFWVCALRTFSQTFWHYSGTCKMGRKNDPTAVVNTRLQVKNIKNLRVGDASIMPTIPTAHLQIPSIAIGEKLADMIKSHWGYHST